MQLFREAVDACSFLDIGYLGSKFTWSKHYVSGQSIWERLDRAFCTNGWLQRFARTQVFHLHNTTLGHVPIWIVPYGLDPPPISKPFRFEEMWLSDKGCRRTVEAVWRAPFPCDPEVQVMKKIAKCGNELTQWSCKHFGSVQRELVKKKKLLVKAEQAALQSSNNYWVRELKKDINGLLIKESQMWRQRAKSFWLVGGDKNSKFFHS